MLKKAWRWLVMDRIDRAILKRAFGLIEAQGMTICKIEHRAGTNYLIDINGTAHKIGGKK